MIGQIVLAAVVMTGTVVAGAEPLTVRLTPTPIVSPELILTGPSRLATGSAGWIPLPEKGAKIAGEGQSGEFTLAGEEVSITWAGERDFTLTAGGKTQGLRPITRSYGLQPTAITLASGQRYTLAFPVGQVGRTPSGTQAAIFYRSGSSQNGTLDGEDVAIYDANTDGVYKRGEDAIRVGPAGKPMVFAPATRYFATSKAIYALAEVEPTGEEIQCDRYEGASGRLEAEFASGDSELTMIVLSNDGQMSSVVTASSKLRPPVLLVPGEYRFRYGVVSVVPQGHITAVLEPTSIKPIAIEDAGSVKLELGAPYKLGFQPASEGMGFKLDPARFTLSGRGDEKYVNYRWASPPDVSLRSGSMTRHIGKISLEDGMLTEFSGQVPDGMGVGERTVTVSGVVQGLGPVKGQALLP